MSHGFGERLRRERERRQISLQSLAASTNIKASLFAALEREDPSQWPPPGIFRRSFVRTYATAIGLDPDATVCEFLELFPDSVKSPASAVAPRLPPLTGAPPIHASNGLRLTLADTKRPFTGGSRLLASSGRRLTAAALDGGLLVTVGLVCFLFLGTFWKPLGVTALCYYLTSILVLGNTPGVCLVAPKARDDGKSDPPHEANDGDAPALELNPFSVGSR